MATYLAVPLKRTWEVDLVKPIRTFIANTFQNANPEDYNNALQEFNKLRNNMISKSVDKHESAIEVLCRYHDQLCAIEGKLPIAENQIRINFKWQDAFDKESFFSGRRTLTIASGSYEKVCVLFNIAALQGAVAECQNHTTDDGLKLSAKLFQQSSGIFQQLKECVLSHVQGEPTPDLHPDTLNALSAFMLAQAQDCFCRKAMTDKMKPATIAKLCHQASDLYADAMKQLQIESIRMLWPKDWIPSAASKQAAFHALAEYYQSRQHAANKEFGEEIARLKHAKELMAAAETRGGYTFIFEDFFKKIYRGLEEAEKDNNFIYHAKIPELNSLPALGKAAVAKPTAFSGQQFAADHQDLFEKVVPLAVHQSLMAFESRKAEIVNTEIGRLREATQTMNGILASLNLPAALDDLSGAKVPASLLEKSNTMKEQGGYDHLSTLMSELPELLIRNKEILDESEKMLSEENSSDQQLKAQFGERWTRTPSEQLTVGIRSEAGKYRTIINNAIAADAVVKEKFAKHREGIKLLSQSEAEIDRALPSGSSSAGLQEAPVVKQLRKYMDEVETIKAEREVVETEIKEAKCDLAMKFTAALAEDGAINEESISMDELDRLYTPLREQVSDSLRRQGELLGHVQRANGEFTQVKSGGGGVSRDQKLKDLAAAFDSFMELKNNLEEGTKFYNDLTQLLVKFQSKVNDFCFARKTEKEELMKDLSSSIARQSSGPPPSQPSYQQPTQAPSNASGGDNKKNPPPARPPPPTLPAQASAPASSAPAASNTSQPPYSAPYPQSNALPYPVYPPAMPQAYNPYGYMPQYPPQQYPQQQQQQQPPYQGYPPYPGYPQQGAYPQQQQPPRPY